MRKNWSRPNEIRMRIISWTQIFGWEYTKLNSLKENLLLQEKREKNRIKNYHFSLSLSRSLSIKWNWIDRKNGRN